MNMQVDSVLAACILHNFCISDKDFFEIPDAGVNETCPDDMCMRDMYQYQGIRVRQQLMNQLLKFHEAFSCMFP